MANKVDTEPNQKMSHSRLLSNGQVWVKLDKYSNLIFKVVEKFENGLVYLVPWSLVERRRIPNQPGVNWTRIKEANLFRTWTPIFDDSNCFTSDFTILLKREMKIITAALLEKNNNEMTNEHLNDLLVQYKTSLDIVSTTAKE